MKLKEFLKEFEGVDTESEIYFNISHGCCGDTLTLEEPYIEVNKSVGKEKIKYCGLNFPSLDFMSSCRSSAAAQSAGKCILRIK